jgi:hypothetical protein
MISLEWRRAQDMAWLPPNAPLQFGKTVVLRGVGYQGSVPADFTLYRVPSKLVSWALTSRGRATRWELARRPAHRNANAPIVTVDSEPVILAPSGFFATHRWQFADSLDNWSPVVRTTRFSSLTASLTGGYAGVRGGVKTTVKTTVDPRLRIDLSLPWDQDKRYPSPQEAIIGEVEDLREIDSNLESPSPADVVESLESFFPGERPPGLDISWEPQELSLDEGEMRTLDVPISSVSRQPFAFCFVATNTETGRVAAISEVGVMWRDEAGAISAFGLEG